MRRKSLVAFVAGLLVVAGCTAPDSGDSGCSNARLREARAAHPAAVIGDDGVVMANLEGIGDVPHPQAAMLFVTNALKAGDVDPGTDCVIRATGRWLVESLTQEGDVWYWFYGFDWAYGDDDRLLSRAPWPSGLAQGNGIIALGMLADYTGEAAYDDAAHRAFSAFASDHSRIRTTLPDGGLFFQEYETDIPTFVLNGNLDALIGIAWYANRYDDRSARAVFDKGVEGLKELLPLFDVTTPQGEVSAYDLIRLHPELRTRTLMGSSTIEVSTVRGFAESVELDPVSGDTPDLIANGGFEDFRASKPDQPTGWKAIITAGGDQFAFPDDDPYAGSRYAEVTTSGDGWEVLGQTIGAASVAEGTYGISFFARARRPLLVPGRVSVVGECPGGRAVLGDEFQIRSEEWAPYGFTFGVEEQGCDLLVELYEFTSTTGEGVIDFDDVSLRQVSDADSLIRLPFSVFEEPTIRATSTGSGTPEVFYEGAWRSLDLSGGELPMYLQGRNIHYGYHDGHVRQLRKIASLSGDDRILLDYARRWEAMVPQP